MGTPARAMFEVWGRGGRDGERGDVSRMGRMMGRSELEHEDHTPPRMAFGPVRGDLVDLKRRSSLSSPGNAMRRDHDISFEGACSWWTMAR